jgi:hypothetical protein
MNQENTPDDLNQFQSSPSDKRISPQPIAAIKRRIREVHEVLTKINLDNSLLTTLYYIIDDYVNNI